MSMLLLLLLLLNITSIAPTSLHCDEEEQNIIAEIDISLSLPSSLCDNIECKHGGTCLQGSCLCPAKTTGKFCEGEQCGEGFCVGCDKCLNNTCKKVDVCDELNDGTVCTVFIGGTCSDGFCLEACSEDSDCGPCIDGICAGPKCGESFCEPG